MRWCSDDDERSGATQARRQCSGGARGRRRRRAAALVRKEEKRQQQRQRRRRRSSAEGGATIYGRSKTKQLLCPEDRARVGGDCGAVNVMSHHVATTVSAALMSLQRRDARTVMQQRIVLIRTGVLRGKLGEDSKKQSKIHILVTA